MAAEAVARANGPEYPLSRFLSGSFARTCRKTCVFWRAEWVVCPHVSQDVRENAQVSFDYSTGKLLVATPQTGGDVFRRSVVLVLHHDDEGAQGVVLNRPLAAPVSSVLPPWHDYVTDPPTVFQGGPVALDSALGLVTVPGDHHEPMGVRLLFGGVGLVDLDIPPLVVVPEVAGLRIFAGYAGWSGGQLEQEIRAGGWYVVESEARDAFTSEPETLWSTVLRRQRGNLAFVASFPEDPTMN